MAALIFTAAFTLTYLYGPKPEPPGVAIFERYTSQRMSERASELEPLFADAHPALDVEAFEYVPIELDPAELHAILTRADQMIDGLQVEVLQRKSFNRDSPRYRTNPVRTQYRELALSLLDSISIVEQNEYFKDMEEPVTQMTLANPANAHIMVAPIFTRTPKGQIELEHKVSLDHFNQFRTDPTSMLFQIPSIFLFGRGPARFAHPATEILQAKENPDLFLVEMIDNRAPIEPPEMEESFDVRRRYRFWLDRSKDYCWVRAEFFQPSPQDADSTPQDMALLQMQQPSTMPTRRIAEAKDFKNVDGIWMPHRITVEEWFFRQELLTTEDFVILDVRPLPNPDGVRNEILALLDDYAPYFFGKTDQPPAPPLAES